LPVFVEIAQRINATSPSKTSHFAGEAAGNPVIQCLQANGGGGLPGGVLYNNQAGTQTHQNLHFTCLQNYANSRIDRFSCGWAWQPSRLAIAWRVTKSITYAWG
jgi:hypothetical protein